MASPPAITAAELAAKVGGALDGDGDVLVRGAAPLDQAGPDELSWIGRPEYLPRLADSRAGVVLIPTGCESPLHRTTIQVVDPDVALCTALALLGPKPEAVTPGTHPSACVAPDAETSGACIGPHVTVGSGAVIGPGTQLHAGVYIGQGARVGRDCVLWPNVVVREHCELGDRVILHANVTIGADGFGYLQRDGRHLKIPQVGRVQIQDDVEIGANSCVDRARSGLTIIGRGTKIDNLVQIAHNVRVGAHCIIVSQCGISGSTELGNGVVLAGQVGVVDHLEIGDGVQVAAQSGVVRDIPAGQVWRGTPAVENNAYARSAVIVRRLPKVVEQIKALEKRVKQLESTADHRT